MLHFSFNKKIQRIALGEGSTQQLGFAHTAATHNKVISADAIAR